MEPASDSPVAHPALVEAEKESPITALIEALHNFLDFNALSGNSIYHILN